MNFLPQHCGAMLLTMERARLGGRRNGRRVRTRGEYRFCESLTRARPYARVGERKKNKVFIKTKSLKRGI